MSEITSSVISTIEARINRRPDTPKNAVVCCTRTEVIDLIASLRAAWAERDELRAAIERERNEIMDRLREARGVDVPCKTCDGLGVRSYPNTTTWRGGCGGQSVTTDVCNACWGTGDADRKGADLRKMRSAIDAAAAEAAHRIDTAESSVIEAARRVVRDSHGTFREDRAVRVPAAAMNNLKIALDAFDYARNEVKP